MKITDEMVSAGVEASAFEVHPDVVRRILKEALGTVEPVCAGVEELEAENAKLRRVLRALVRCVDDGCFCSEMRMAAAIDDANDTLKENEQ